ncbi:hypothetical protein ACHAW5_002135 [Stephanodiscus triporus]|uniref:Uncharacterized protein n=1 Tax=Stephanodiscus triporus TaxID=2934178 RepID=A0ABD3PZ16_9STRA
MMRGKVCGEREDDDDADDSVIAGAAWSLGTRARPSGLWLVSRIIGGEDRPRAILVDHVCLTDCRAAPSNLAGRSPPPPSFTLQVSRRAKRVDYVGTSIDERGRPTSFDGHDDDEAEEDVLLRESYGNRLGHPVAFRLTGSSGCCPRSVVLDRERQFLDLYPRGARRSRELRIFNPEDEIGLGVWSSLAKPMTGVLKPTAATAVLGISSLTSFLARKMK